MVDDTRASGLPRDLSHYRLERQVGAGGMGSVFLGVDRRDGSRVAVKLLHPMLAAAAEFRERFESEAHVAALLRSPYTVHLLDYGHEGDTYFLVMEYVEGQTLAEALREGPLPVEQALRIGISVARALEEAAARGVVHRDIKTENIMLLAEGGVKVADFGISRRAGVPGLTLTGAFLGTPDYAAPEQFEGQADERTDIYALGVTLFAMLAGRPPFEGTPLELMRQHRESTFPRRRWRTCPNQPLRRFGGVWRRSPRRAIRQRRRSRPRWGTRCGG